MTEETPPRRIVCGIACRTDDEDRIRVAETDRHTAAQAIDLAARTRGSVVLVHVVDWLPDRANIDGEAILGELRDELASDLEEISAQADARGVEHRHEMRVGKPWKELLAVGDEEDADLVVISPRRERHTLGSRIFRGSTATRILKTAHRPVWIVEPHCEAPTRILALLDRSAVSPVVARDAERLADLFDAELYGLCCLEYPSDISLQRLPGARDAIAKYHQEVRDEAREELASLTDGSERWKLLLGEDWVVRLAPRVVAEKEIDLVVMGATSRPRLAGALLGTTAQRLLDHVSVSTWVLRPEETDANEA